MKSYLIIGILATLLCLTVWTGTSSGADETKTPQQECLAIAKACSDCQLQCDMCFKNCLRQIADGKFEHAACAQLCVDCAECCKLASSLSARNSAIALEACECCAKCCDKCADVCEKVLGDKSMLECAKCCRECAKACRMIKNVRE